MAQPTLNVKTSTDSDLCPLDLGDILSSRAEYLVSDVEIARHKEKTQGKIRFQKLETYLFFFGHLWLYICTVRSIVNNKNLPVFILQGPGSGKQNS